MTKILIHIVLVCFPVILFAQKKDKAEKQITTREKWHQIREEHGYKQSDKYKGPESDYYQSPTSINESYSSGSGSPNGTTKPYQGTPYSPKDLQRGKGKDGKGGTGSIEEDPNVEPAESVDIPDFDPPRGPNVDLNTPNISINFWKVLGIILLIAALAVLIFFIIKNRSPRVKTIPFEALVEDLNPAEISKTELELRLEEATAAGNYKECVRIYFLFAMKELIQRRWIFWKKEKTNMHYIIEIQGKVISREFEQIVSIYDLVWYGDYSIDSANYQVIEPKLKAAFQKIEKA